MSCNGHPTLHTPHLDALAARGVNFTRAYCQSPVCGPSRMSSIPDVTCSVMALPGITCRCPLVRGPWEIICGHLACARCSLAKPICALMTKAWHGCSSMRSPLLGVLVSQCGFEPYERDDGLHPDQSADPNWPITAIYGLGLYQRQPLARFCQLGGGDPTVRC